MLDHDKIHPGNPLPQKDDHLSCGRFEQVLREGHFAVTAELAPLDSSLATDVYEQARLFDGFVDGMNATDGSGAHCHMSSVAMCAT
jgi:methylenetetrahydrofolate reductase (NADPH)